MLRPSPARSDRGRLFDGKCRRGQIDNARVLRLEALYTFHYLLPDHHARTVYVFFPDPWPKKKHHSHRLFGPIFRTALWKRLALGGKLEFATDHQEYFEEDMALCEFVSTSKLPVQKILRNGLALMMEEVG